MPKSYLFHFCDPDREIAADAMAMYQKRGQLEELMKPMHHICAGTNPLNGDRCICDCHREES